MTLQPGTRLGPYEVEGPLGAGGMGEVYRAKDTRLDRAVAVKVLPDRIAEDPRLQERFEREARALAGFSHPHICTLHDVGNERGVRFLVMELLEGETLAARLERGALPLDEALDTGIQLADALDAAHRRGVTHRDVKPANIVLTSKGAKLLDFGLARGTSAPAPELVAESAETVTRRAAVTAEGALVGTLRYMAPEQVEGREADARSDLFALGSVLYAMIGGRPPFHGNSQAGLIAAILKEDPVPLSDARPALPPALCRVVDRCLEKDPELRWQSARDLLLELKWVAENRSPDAPRGPVTAGNRWPERIAWSVAVVLLAAVLAFVANRSPRTSNDPRVTRLSLTLPHGTSSSFAFARLSPDGRTMVLSLSSEGQRQLWLRPLDSLASRPLPGTRGARFPFWSPDGQRVGYFADGKLRTVDARGGPSQILCDAPGPFPVGSWSDDGTILFSIVEAPGRDGLYRVPEAGGAATKLEMLDESSREWFGMWPSFLPGGRHFLLFCGVAPEGSGPFGLCVVSLETGRPSMILELPAEETGTRAEYAAPGYLVYTRSGALMARPFDARRRVISGEPVTLVEQVAQGPSGLGDFAVAGDVLAYQEESTGSELLWKDRNGRTLGRVSAPGPCTDVKLSPDGRKLALSSIDQQRRQGDIWIVDLERDIPTRFTSDLGDDMNAIWSSDGKRIAFSSAREAPPFLHVKSVAGNEEEVLLPSDGTLHSPDDWTPDGRLLYSVRAADTKWDIWMLRPDDGQPPVPFLQTPDSELNAVVSPDGNWVAYASNESGRMEIYVLPFPDGGEKHRVSTDGGFAPHWSGDGKEIYYLSPDNHLVAVAVRAGESFEARTPRSLFAVEPAEVAFRPYDVSPDGKRFIVISAPPEESVAPVVVTGWSALVPR